MTKVRGFWVCLHSLYPACNRASCKLCQTCRSTRSAPHTDLGFGSIASSFARYRVLAETAFSRTTYAQVRTLGTSVHLRERRGFCQVTLLFFVSYQKVEMAVMHRGYPSPGVNAEAFRRNLVRCTSWNSALDCS